jgi:gliding motility-associated lipoprotein GldD
MTKRLKVLIGVAILIAGALTWTLLLSGDAIPKPRGYFRIDLPEHAYTEYDTPCALRLPMPNSSKLELVENHVGPDSCWFNISYPKLNAKIHCTYVRIQNNFDRLVNDAFEFASKHQVKASGIRTSFIEKPENKVFGVVYEMDGEAASQVQFYLTDSTQHFMRGALYFFNAPNPDSIAPVLQFIREDLIHMTTNLQWKN